MPSWLTALLILAPIFAWFAVAWWQERRLHPGVDQSRDYLWDEGR